MKTILLKKTTSLFFILYSFFKKDKKIKKFEKQINFENDYYTETSKKNPAYIFLKSNNQITKNKITEGYELIKNFEKIKINWNNKNESLKTSSEKDIIPSCRVLGSIGNYRTVFNYLFNRINILKIKKKPKIFIKKYDKINNNYLFSHFKPYLDFHCSSYSYYKNINKIYYHKTPIEITLPYKHKYYPWAISENLINQYRLKNKDLSFDYFRLSKKDFEKGKKILENNNLNNYRWYVSIHIRESKKSDDQSHRNSNPENYIKLIEEILSRGGAVFRVGDNSMTQLPKMKGLIDYPFSEMKSEFMDVFLAATSKFVVGTSSGFWTIASFFNTPLMMTNYIPTKEYFTFNQNCLFIPKFFYRDNEKILTIKETYLNNDFPYYNNIDQYKKKSIYFKENTTDDLHKSVKDMFDLLSNNSKDRENLINLNNQFKKSFFGTHVYDENKLMPLANFSRTYIRNFIST